MDAKRIWKFIGILPYLHRLRARSSNALMDSFERPCPSLKWALENVFKTDIQNKSYNIFYAKKLFHQKYK